MGGEFDISIHALRKESDDVPLAAFAACEIFQSTLSVRRATQSFAFGIQLIQISIHALRKESDFMTTNEARRILFQSTLSVRRATVETWSF